MEDSVAFLCAEQAAYVTSHELAGDCGFDADGLGLSILRGARRAP